MVLVRQSELACRNSWDQDLWEPGVESLREPLLMDGAEVDSVVSSSIVRRQRHDEIFGGSEFVPMPPMYGEAADRVTGFEFGGVLTAVDAETNDEPQQRGSEHDPMRVRSKVLETRNQRDQERRAEIQKRQIYDLDAIDERMRSSDAISAPSGESYAHSGNREPEVRSGSNAISTETLRQPQQDGGQPARSPVASSVKGQHSPGLRGQVRVNEEPASGGHQPTEQLPIVAENGQHLQSPIDSKLHEPFVHVDGRVYGGDSVVEAAQSAATFIQPEVNDPIDQQERLRTVRRCCGTCRDFRQVGDGSRGQCVNPYAFGDRRMVQSDQLACRSSLGMWWMPNDEVWLERADTSHHGRPTPLLDAALRAKRGDEAGRDSRQ